MKFALNHFLLLLVAGFIVGETNGSVVEESSTGAFKSELQSPVFYTTFVPIIYEIQVPKWREDDLRIKWLPNHGTSCNTSDSTSWSSGTACASRYHYNTIISSFFLKTTASLKALGST